MAKRKNAEKVTEARADDAGAECIGEIETIANDETTTIVEAATPAYIADEAAFLAAEVQSFLSKRSELADRLAREIEATERRLEELRRSLALLSPAASNAAEPAKPEKKAKKPTLKKAEKKPTRKDEPGDEAESTNEAVASAPPQASDEVAA